MRTWRIGLLLALVFLFAGTAAAQNIYIADVSGAISPGTAEYVGNAIRTAEDHAAACLIIRLDTPGGLSESMRRIVIDILGSRVPVVVYVWPSGARAASAGVMITMAADVAAMAPGTNIGAAHPVGIGGKDINGTMSEKIVNDMVAQAKSVAEKRGRNGQWVEKAIRESVSITDTEALASDVIDIVAKNLDDLIRQLNGRTLKDKGKLNLAGAHRVFIKEGLRSRILRAISDPNIAYILLIIGLAGLYFEFSHPGAVLPGVVGGIAIILAFFALQTLPVNVTGVLLILLAVVFFVLELKVASFGMLSLAGVLSLLLGSLMLFKDVGEGVRVSLEVLLPTVILVSAFFMGVAALVFRAHLRQVRTGVDGLIGDVGIVRHPLNPEGKVFIHGELWQAIADTTIEAGARVRVISVTGLKLRVARENTSD